MALDNEAMRYILHINELISLFGFWGENREVINRYRATSPGVECAHGKLSICKNELLATSLAYYQLLAFCVVEARSKAITN